MVIERVGDIVQTFLTSVNFEETAKDLDNKRLNKQLLEGRQILSTLTGRSDGWQNHPAVKMWAGSEWILFEYLHTIREECKARGIKTDTNWEVILRTIRNSAVGVGYPTWMLNDDILHRITATHRGNLYRKDPVFYEKFAEFADYKSLTCCPRCNYYWPVASHGYKE